MSGSDRGRARRLEGAAGDQRLRHRKPGRHLAGFDELKDDGSTTCASWIYCGVFPAPDQNLAARKEPDPPGVAGAELNWGWAWPANRRVLYNRASADLQGRPWSERKKWIWWDGKQWTGLDIPDFPVTKSPDARGDPKGIGLDALSGRQPFIMIPDGMGWLLQPVRSARRPASHPLRARRVAGQKRAVPAADRARCSSTGSTTATRSPRSAIRASPT